MPTEGTPDTPLWVGRRRHPMHSRRRKRTDALRNVESYFPQSTRVLAAEYADGFRTARPCIGHSRTRPCHRPGSAHRPSAGRSLHQRRNPSNSQKILLRKTESCFAESGPHLCGKATPRCRDRQEKTRGEDYSSSSSPS